MALGKAVSILLMFNDLNWKPSKWIYSHEITFSKWYLCHFFELTFMSFFRNKSFGHCFEANYCSFFEPFSSNKFFRTISFEVWSVFLTSFKWTYLSLFRTKLFLNEFLRLRNFPYFRPKWTTNLKNNFAVLIMQTEYQFFSSIQKYSPYHNLTPNYAHFIDQWGV